MQTLHASTVAVDGRAVLITGASGSGKSALALQLMAHGAQLVADDRTLVECDGESIVASCPAAISGLIEARGAGILNAEPSGPVPVALVVDLDHVAVARLPAARTFDILGRAVPCLHKIDASHFPAAILQYLRWAAQE